MVAVWIDEKLKYFEREQEMLDQGQPYESENDDDDGQWGVYAKEPSTEEPQGDLHLEWVYIVDLDNSCFTIRSGSGWSRQFKLGNLPYHLFERGHSKEGILVMPVSLEQMYSTTTPAADYDVVQLDRFTKFSPRQTMIKVSQEESHFTTSLKLDSWKPLSQLLLEKFLERYIKTIKDLARPNNLAILESTGLGGHTSTAYRFRQIAYGILSLCDSPGRIRFRKGTCSYQAPQKYEEPRHPDWEAPISSNIWMGEVLVILEPRITVQEFLYAAIGKAIDMIGRSQVNASGTSRTAVIFSIQSLVIVTMKDGNDGEPDITYSQSLPVITPSDCQWYRFFGGFRTEPTPGLDALLNVFASQRESYSLPAGLPFELCAEIYKLSNLATRKSLTATCLAFRAIETANPLIGEWELFNTWSHGNVGFVAARGKGLARSVVDLEECGFRMTGFKVGIFRGGHVIDLDLPWLQVVKRQQDGFEGCHCCRGLPVRRAMPVMMGRTIDVSRIEEERNGSSSSD